MFNVSSYRDTVSPKKPSIISQLGGELRMQKMAKQCKQVGLKGLPWVIIDIMLRHPLFEPSVFLSDVFFLTCMVRCQICLTCTHMPICFVLFFLFGILS